MNTLQLIHLQRIALAGKWNDFDGELIVEKLIEFKKHWISLVFGSFGYCDLIELRDMKDGHCSGDTIMLLCNKSDFPIIAKIAKECNANEIGYIYYNYEKDSFEVYGTFTSSYKNFHQSFGSVVPKEQIVVRLWWD